MKNNLPDEIFISRINTISLNSIGVFNNIAGDDIKYIRADKVQEKWKNIVTYIDIMPIVGKTGREVYQQIKKYIEEQELNKWVISNVKDARIKDLFLI